MRRGKRGRILRCPRFWTRRWAGADFWPAEDARESLLEGIAMKMLMALVLALTVAGCGGGYSPLNARYLPERAKFGNDTIPVVPPAPHVDILNPDPTAR